MKKRIAGLVCIMVFAAVFTLIKMPTIFAQGSEAKTYSLEDATSKALSSSNSLKLIGEKITFAQKKVDSATDSIDRDKKTKDLEDLRQQLADKQNAMEIEVSRLYYQILIKDQAINVQNNRIARLTKEMQMKQKQIELGNDTEVSLLAYKVSVADAQAKLSSLRNEREKLVMSLNVDMGNDVSTSIILKSRDIPDGTVSVNNSNIAQVAEDLTLDSYSITSRMKLLDIDSRSISNYANQLLTATTSTVASLTAKKTAAEEDKTKIEYEIEDEQNAIQVKVRTDYNDILNAKDTVEVKRLDYEKNTKLAQIAKLKYDLGMIIYTEYSKAQEDADDSLWAYQQAKLDYYILTEQYKNYIKPAL